MNKGIILEIQKKHVLLLTRDGSFVKWAKKRGNYAVGQEVMFAEEELLPNRKHLFSSPFLKPIFLFVCFFLITTMFSYNQQQEKVMAYVSVDINPSVEVSVDSKLRALHIEAYNTEGKQIVKGIKNWKKQPLSHVVEQVINQCQLDGYLTKGKQVALTSVVTDNNKKFQQKLEPILQTVKTKYAQKSVSIVYQEGTVQMREDAKGSKMSIGAYIEQVKTKQSPLVIPETLPPSSEKRHDSGIQEETTKESMNREKKSSSQSNNLQEQIEQKQEQLSPDDTREEQTEQEQKQEQLPPDNKREEQMEQERKQELLSPDNKREEQTEQEQKQELLSPDDKREEQIKQKKEPFYQNDKIKEKIEMRKQSPRLPIKERQKKNLEDRSNSFSAHSIALSAKN